MNKSNLLLVFVFITFHLFPQKDSLSNDSTIKFSDLNFSNNIERNLFMQMSQKQDVDIFNSFYASNAKAEVKGMKDGRELLNNLLHNYQTPSFNKKKPTKKIKIIFKEVHDTFFRKYEYDNEFIEIFTKGNYNCVSATALYSIVLSEVQIPYNIKVLPTHVYLIAYPKSDKIAIETTDPQKGYFQFDEKFQQRYIEELLKSKTISTDELQSKSLTELFNEYFLTADDADIHELLGIQYFNKGMYLIVDENYQEAAIELEKAVVIYPDEKVIEALASCYSKILMESEYETKEDVEYFKKLIHFKEIVGDDEVFLGEFYRLTEAQLLESGDTAAYRKIYDDIVRIEEVNTFKDELSLIYFTNLSDVHSNNLQFYDASINLKKALKIDSTNLRYLNGYVKLYINYLETISDKEVVLEMMNRNEIDMPALDKQPLYNAYKADALSRMMSQSFVQNDFSSGEIYRKKLEALLEDSEVGYAIQNNIAIAYANASSGFFRRGSKNTAIKLLKKGLEYAPDHFELRARLKMIQNN